MTYTATTSKPSTFVQPTCQGDALETGSIGLGNAVIQVGYGAVTRRGE